MRVFVLSLVLLLAGIALADDFVVTPSNLAPHAFTAKQIAPGTSRIFSVRSSYAACDSCNISGKTESTSSDPKLHYIDDDIVGSDFRLEINLFHFLWPKTQNIEGAENWTGHNFGGGLFLNAHYAYLLEAGLAPTIVQWLGPIYLGASYEFTFGRYYGRDEDDERSSDLAKNLFTGALNAGGGSMLFMNNHGLGLGMHGGIRQLHIINPGSRKYTSHDPRTGDEINPENQGGYHIQDWIFYYGFDIVGYTNLPLLKESNSKGHAAYAISLEMGVHTDDNPLIFWAFSFSLML
jgi:hypothetical protein